MGLWLLHKTFYRLPFGVFASFILLPATTEKFKDAFYVPAVSWETITYIIIFITLMLTIKNGIKAYMNRKISISTIIEKMKGADKQEIKKNKLVENEN